MTGAIQTKNHNITASTLLRSQSVTYEEISTLWKKNQALVKHPDDELVRSDFVFAYSQYWHKQLSRPQSAAQVSVCYLPITRAFLPSNNNTIIHHLSPHQPHQHRKLETVNTIIISSSCRKYRICISLSLLLIRIQIIKFCPNESNLLNLIQMNLIGEWTKLVQKLQIIFSVLGQWHFWHQIH